MISVSRLIGVFALLALHSAAQAAAFYCPNTRTDSDGDGWGFEDNRSCIVISAPEGTPVCGSDAIDSDGDGWGWESGRSCLIDHVVQSNFIAGGEIIAAPDNMPDVNLIQTSSGNQLRYATVSSDGIIYGHRPGLNLLTSMDQAGNIIWEVPIDGFNSVDIVRLNPAEDYLILKMAAGQVASYNLDGSFRWSTDTFELIRNMAITEDTIIIQREGWENGTPDLDYKSIVSLDHSGQQIWEFKPAGFLDHFIIGNDNRIYVTVSTGSGESIHVFDE